MAGGGLLWPGRCRRVLHLGGRPAGTGSSATASSTARSTSKVAPSPSVTARAMRSARSSPKPSGDRARRVAVMTVSPPLVRETAERGRGWTERSHRAARRRDRSVGDRRRRCDGHRQGGASRPARCGTRAHRPSCEGFGFRFPPDWFTFVGLRPCCRPRPDGGGETVGGLWPIRWASGPEDHTPAILFTWPVPSSSGRVLGRPVMPAVRPWGSPPAHRPRGAAG